MFGNPKPDMSNVYLYRSAIDPLKGPANPLCPRQVLASQPRFRRAPAANCRPRARRAERQGAAKAGRSPAAGQHFGILDFRSYP